MTDFAPPEPFKVEVFIILQNFKSRGTQVVVFEAQHRLIVFIVNFIGTVYILFNIYANDK